MPDMERLIDKFALDHAKVLGPEKYNYIQGYIQGKTDARKEVLTVFCVCMALFVVVSLMLA